jgi:nitrous oxidase accessory protein NosD
MKLTRIALMVVGVLAVSTARAERLSVPDEFATLQAAVNAAAPGDEILVKKDQSGRAVLNGKTDLVIRGRGKPVVGDLDIVHCSNVFIQGLVVEGSGGAAIYLLLSTDVTIRKCTIRDAPRDGILVVGGERLIVEKCRFKGIGEIGIAIGGENLSVLTHAQILKNRMSSIGLYGIGLFDGRVVLAEKNRISHAAGGVYVGPRTEGDYSNSAQNAIVANKITGCPNGVVVLQCSRNRIERNRCDDAIGQAYFIGTDDSRPGDGDGNWLYSNRANRPGTGVIVASNDNYIEANVVKRPAESGFFLIGQDTARNELAGNVVSRAGEDGFWVMGLGHTLIGNRAKKSGRYGFSISATGCDITENRAKGSGVSDLRDWGGQNDYSGNDFRTIQAK